jgi:prepilin-type N-terminal cleavage/methylation domain-containing protein
MKNTRLNITAPAGFTLVEIIATIIIMGILSSIFIHFMGTALDNSWKSVDFVAGEAEAEAKLEEIIAYFTSRINSDPDNALSSVVSQFGGQADIEYVEFDVNGNLAVVSPGASPTLRVSIQAPGNNLETILTQSRTKSDDPKVNY